jgi:alpha-D-ribose 1-methylphosphonate 5-triphosphate synthase subunit PhnH
MAGALVLGVHASQRTFGLLLDALSSPGQVMIVNDPPAVAAGAAVVALAFARSGTPVAIVGDEQLAAEVAEATLAALVPVGEARLVALMRPDAAQVAQCRTGRAVPSDVGAKVGIACTRLASYPPRAGAWQAAVPQADAPGVVLLGLSGPGTGGVRRVIVEGVGREIFQAISLANRELPHGLDTWLVDEEGRVVGISRTTTIEIVS